MTSAKAAVFLGGGRITSALVAGLRLAGYEREIVVYDRNPEKMRALRREARVQMARDLKSAVLRAEMLIVAVRPASVAGILQEILACGVSRTEALREFGCGGSAAQITWAAGGAVGARDAESSLPRGPRVDGAEL